MAGSHRTLLSLLLAVGLTHCGPPTEAPPQEESSTEAPSEKEEVDPEEVGALRGSCPRAYLVEDSAEGPEGSSPVGLTDLDGRLVYWADDGVHGEELWAIPLSDAGCPSGSR